jgi:hypothetical protein
VLIVRTGYLILTRGSAHMSLIFHSALRKLNMEPSIGASYQVSVHLAKQFQSSIRFFRN